MEHTHTFLRFPGGRAKALSFTIDDGVVEDRWMIERFGELGLCGTFNLNSGYFPVEGEYAPFESYDVYFYRRPLVNAEEAAHLYGKPYVEVASHGWLHADPSLIDAQALVWDIMYDRHNLEKLFHYPVTGFAYPQGVYDAKCVDVAKICGLEYCRTVNFTNEFDLPEDFFHLNPTCEYQGDAFEDAIDRFLSFKPTTGLYYSSTRAAFFNVFAHADDVGGVDKLEELVLPNLKRLAGHEDVWYATNIQVVRYVKAYNSLVFSADRSTVYNPSAQSVWIYCSAGTVEIPAGQTVKL